MVRGARLDVEELHQGVPVLVGQVGVLARFPGGTAATGSDARVRLDPEQGQEGRGHVDQPAVTVDHAQSPDARPGQDERGPGLDHTEGTVLTAMIHLVVGGGVQDAEVGGAGMVEDLGDVFPGIGVAVGPPVGLPGRQFGRQRGETGGVLVGQGIASLHGVDVEGPSAGRGPPPEPDGAVDGAGLVQVGSGRGDDHLHQRLEVGVQEDLEGGLEPVADRCPTCSRPRPRHLLDRRRAHRRCAPGRRPAPGAGRSRSVPGVRAVVCRELGSLDHVVVEERPTPVAGPGQVVVDVKAMGVNYVDGLICQGRYQLKPAAPYVPGGELAGVVSAVADGVTRVSVETG